MTRTPATRPSPCAPVTLALAGDWQVRLTTPAGTATTVAVPLPELVTVAAERYEALPVFHPEIWGGWAKGIPLRGLIADECTTKDALDPAALEVFDKPGVDARRFVHGEDYEADFEWASVGRLAGGRIAENQPVFVSYRYARQRLDSILLTPEGRILLRKGVPHIATPLPPNLRTGETRLANIWINGRLPRLTPEHLFPILETEYPEPPLEPGPTAAERFLPNAMRKLREGRTVKILAWGDSVTEATYLAGHAEDRWQAQFVTRLRKRFPKASIELVTEGWGGRNTEAYLAEPPGSVRNYQEKVLAVKPDLVVSEFVNDAGLTPEQVEERYGRLLKDFQSIGAEWIILTPHYVRGDWMNLTREHEIDDDPRPYVTGLRAFARKHGVALAEGSLRYGRLWRQGIPHITLMGNNINHPDVRGMRLFADSLMAIFPPPPARR